MTRRMRIAAVLSGVAALSACELLAAVRCYAAEDRLAECR